VADAWSSEDKYRTLFESIDEGFCVIEVLFDADGLPADYVFLEVNPAFERQTGLVDAQGRTMRSLAPTHEEHWFRTYGHVATTGTPVRFEAPAEALKRWYDVYAFRVGAPEQYLVAILFNDISKRKELEREVETQNDALRQADLRKDRLLATVSHELRNPLAPLTFAADILAREGLSAADLRRTRDIIQRQVGQMARILDDLLDVARVTQGKLVLRRQPVRPAELVEGAVETARPLIERKHHALEVDIEPGAPLLDVDPARLSQVITNLLTNAAKYTDIGGRIAVRGRTEGEEFVIAVEDNGIGIPPAALATVFEMFSQPQEAGSERAEGGLGIGLALVKALVELHGGSVEAHSAGVGKGSTFVLRLPMMPVA
jgi:PAS domain S-box-containing protein